MTSSKKNQKGRVVKINCWDCHKQIKTFITDDQGSLYHVLCKACQAATRQTKAEIIKEEIS